MYYHAGTEYTSGAQSWSDRTRRSYDVAVREARKMAREQGGRPIVEWWDKRHGFRPCDCERVAGAEYVGDCR